MRWLVVAGLVFGLAWMAVGSEQQKPQTGYVGAETCAQCHQNAFSVWQRSSHSKASAALPNQHTNDTRCVRCHGVHFKDIRGVQCESCHGAGRHYAKRYVMKDRELSRIVGLEEVTETTCKRCHTESSPSITPFAYGTMWEIIQHGSEPKPDKAP